MILPIPNAQMYMAATEVTRWHTIETTRQQNLAEHQWNVTMLTVTIFSRWKPDCEIKATNLMAALTHDLEEIEDGDVPSYKAEPKEIATRINRMDPWGQAQKMADLIDAAWFIQHHVVTPRGIGRAVLCVNRMQSVISLLHDPGLMKASRAVWEELHDV